MKRVCDNSFSISESNLSKDIKNLNNLINKLNNSNSPISLDKIQDFLNNNLRLIANQKDKILHGKLMLLSNRITHDWNNPKANKLSFVIMGVAKGVLNFKSPLPELPWDIWEKILSYIPPRDTILCYKAGKGFLSGLEDFYPSKDAQAIAKKAENSWAGEMLVSLKKYRCTTAKEAIAYAIINEMSGANLSEFPDLKEEDLEKLFNECPHLTKLFVQSNNIKTLSKKELMLTELICTNCQNLESLPALPLVQELDCSGSRSLQSLPALPVVQMLRCTDCQKLQRLPELPEVKILICGGYIQLLSLPELPQVQHLNCTLCPNLQRLPDLSQVQELHCGMCYRLAMLPELPLVEYLNCSLCLDLQSVPSLPQVRELNCSGCRFLYSLPNLPQLEMLNCRYCVRLENLPELPEGTEVFR